METLNQVLKVLFQEVRSEDIISLILSTSGSYNNFDCLVKEDIFVRQLLHVDTAMTLDHAEVVYHVLHDEWAQPNIHDYVLMYSKKTNIFNILLHFSHDKIYLGKDYPVCKYPKLLSWHEMTCEFGEDLFITSYLAAYDLKNKTTTSQFDWDSYIKNDARELTEMFAKDMYDVHAHLYGSSLNFELNWLCLMNVISGHEKKFEIFDEAKVYPTTSYKLDFDTRPLYVKVLLAAIIRLYLFLDVISESWSQDIMRRLNIWDALKCKSLIDILSYANEAQTYIDTLGFYSARKYFDVDTSTKHIPDYAISGNDDNIFSVLGGERRLMYLVFRKIYSGEYESDKKTALFYTYLLIKEELRKEMVQINNSLGFENFSDYQNRKCMFIENGSVYDQLLSLLAVGSFMNEPGKKRFMEVRIAPKSTAKEDVLQILQNDINITNKFFSKKNNVNKKNFYYIYHFIKLKEMEWLGKDDAQRYSLLPRHFKMRQIIAHQSKAIRKLMYSNHDAACRLVGIDAANSEIHCRPEVFAVAFRYLARPVNCSNENDNEHRYSLGRTFHVGEDFYDIIDGLRAIDEVLVSMHFQNGDRLGHALSLGVDVTKYYQNHNFRVNATRQILLDNITWLYINAKRIGCSNRILAYLHELYSNYYHLIFSSQEKMTDIFTYYQSWLLRGDEPSCYQQAKKKFDLNISDDILDSWNKVILNRSDEVEEARCNKEACRLYYMYHFNNEVRVNGAKSEVFKIKSDYRLELIEVIKDVQQLLLTKIEHFHISIECNPSSNFKIGEIQRYDEHPILKFNNHGLDSPNPRHSICVSINTDDAGIFSTSLEREYSLMALALEKQSNADHNNTPREIIKWLDGIRLMSKEQFFHK